MTKLHVSLPDEVDLRHTADVIVVGGGPGGIGAAVATAREGADVLLVEHYGFLGGMATAGEVNPFMPNHHDKTSLDQGIFSEWLERIHAYGDRSEGLNERVFDPHCARLAAEDMCLDAGVRILYHHRVAHVERKDARIAHLVLHSKSGLTGAQAQVYVDSTGDGDLAALAGAEFEYGGENTDYVQPMTLCFKLKLHLHRLDAEYTTASEATRKESALIQEVFKRAREEGRTSNPRENILIFPSIDPDVIHFNSTRVIHKSAIRGEELSAAETEGRQQMRDILDMLRAEVPCFKYATIYSIAPQIGIRESRRILGRAYVTRSDYEVGMTYPDGIARVTYPIDIHNPDGTGTEITHLPSGAWYEIPYGCLVPRAIDNLLVGSRCISVDHAVHSSVRVMPPVCSLGQAAGTAAAMAVSAGVACHELDGALVKERLVAQGRNLVPYDPERRWEMTDEEAARMVKKNEARARNLSA